MTREKILQKAIKKAIENGWRGWHSWPQQVVTFKDGKQQSEVNTERTYTSNDLIFDHGFAKALWGEDCRGIDGTPHKPFSPMDCVPEWQIKLREMVTSPDPLKYLEDNM